MYFTSRHSTLTVNGLTWSCRSHDGKTLYWYGSHTISYDFVDNLYHIKKTDKKVFSSASVAKCLEIAHEFVLDYYADLIVPSWENGSDPFNATVPSN